jgi:hypothetical protein
VQPRLVRELFLAVLGLLAQQPNASAELLKVPVSLRLAVSSHPLDRRHIYAAVDRWNVADCCLFAATCQNIFEISA